jgi:hypothetical protein
MLAEFWLENMKKSWSKWEDNIKVDKKEIGLESLDWIYLA